METNNAEVQSKKSKIKEILFTDRGGTNTREIFSKIKDTYIEIIGFSILIIMMSSLFLEQILRAFCHISIMEQAFFIIGAIAEVFAIIYVARSFMVGEKQSFKEFVKTHIWDILLFIMLPIATISAFRADDLYAALWGVMFRHDGLFSYLIYASLYVCAKAIKSNKLRRWLLRTMTMLICSLSINTLLQYNMEWIEKMGEVGSNICRYGLYSSIYFNINHFEYILILGLMAAGTLVVIEDKKVLKFIWLFVFGFELWGLIINNTFAGFVAVVLGTAFMLLVMFVRDKKRLVSCFFVIIVLILVSVITNYKNDGILEKNIGVTYNDAKTMDSNDAGGSGRIGLWKDSIDFIKEKPWLGYGPEGMYQLMISGEIEGDRPHNEYLQHALYMGIPAGICYIVALLALFITMLKKLKYLPNEIIAMGIVVFAYCVSAFFGNTLYNTVPYFFMFLGGISVCGMIKKEDNENKVKLEK